VSNKTGRDCTPKRVKKGGREKKKASRSLAQRFYRKGNLKTQDWNGILKKKHSGRPEKDFGLIPSLKAESRHRGEKKCQVAGGGLEKGRVKGRGGVGETKQP